MENRPNPSRSFATRTLVSELFLLATLVMIPSVAHSQTTWTGATSSDWFNPSNWTAGVPTATLPSIINGGPEATIVTSAADALSLTVGSNLPSTLLVFGGGDLRTTEDSVIGDVSESSKLSIAGFESNFVGQGKLTVGRSGNGELNISANAMVLSGAFTSLAGALVAQESTSTSTVNITGAGSSWQVYGPLDLGVRGSAYLNIAVGGKLDNLGFQSSTAIEPGSHAAVSVSGWLSTWQASSIDLGVAGESTLDLDAGGGVNTADMNVGIETGSVGVITLGSSGGQLGIRTSLTLGDQGVGELIVLGGTAGTQQTTSILLAKEIGSVGKVEIAGPFSELTGKTLAMGLGDASLDVRQGGVVAISDRVAIAPHRSATVVDDRSKISTRTLYSEGSLNVSNGGKVVSHSVELKSLEGETSSATFDGGNTILSNQDLVEMGGAGVSRIELTNNARVVSPNTTLQSSSSGHSIIRLNRGFWQGLVGKFKFESGANVVDILDGSTMFVSNLSSTGGDNQVLVTGTDSLLNVGAIIAEDSVDHFRVEAGGRILTNETRWNGKELTLDIDGDGSLYRSGDFNVNSTESTRITVRNGGQFLTGRSSFATDLAAGPVDVLIDGEGSSWIANDLRVGLLNRGSILVSNGAEIVSSGAVIRSQDPAGVVVKISGPGSSWNAGGELGVGVSGRGRLSIEDGATVTSAGAALGGENSDGRVSISGEGSSWISSERVRLGLQGHAELDIADGAYMSAPFFALLAGNTRLDAGTIESPNIILSQATLQNNGLLVGRVNVSADGLLTGSGVFDGLVSVTNHGTFSPGNSPGTATTPTTTWGAGGSYQWEINALEGMDGQEGSPLGWDLWNTGELAITGPFTIEITSLTLDDIAGPLTGWNPARSHLWRIATATHGGFEDISNLQMSTSSFANPLAGGTFSFRTSADGNELFVRFSAVPEASSMILVGVAGLLGIGMAARRQRQNASDS
ncbi:hypothetical protein K2X85_07870 [bacterium]|nr:hypothetical protein [bacterium]